MGDIKMREEIDFKEIYEGFRPKIFHYLCRLVGPSEAEDLTQIVFEKARNGLGSFREESKLFTWLYRIASNTALDRLRSQTSKRRSEHTPLEDNVGIEDRNVWTDQAKTSIDQELIQKEMSECVREFIDRLTPDYRTVLILSDLEGFKNREIVDILQVSLDTVKIRLHRARARLKKELDDGCNFYHNEQNILSCDRKLTSIELKTLE